MEDPIIQHLLHQVTAVSKKYDELAKITGERYNIFTILEVSTSEVRMHSALISNLLNSHGSHGCGDIFLNLFVNQQLAKGDNSAFGRRLEKFTIKGSKSKVEHHISFINEDRSEGGRIDILLKDNHNRHIIIENKIYAGDQPQQLTRYNNFDTEAPIFYLTLNGKAPSRESINDLKENDNFTCISYKEDILLWLESCKKECANSPLLRETIQQYIYLIKALTNQTTNQKMGNEISSLIIKDVENFISAHDVKDAIDNSYKLLLEKFKSQMLDVATELNLTLDYRVDFNKQHTGFDFSHPNIDQDNLRIRFHFCGTRTEYFIYGIARNSIGNDATDVFIKEHGMQFKKTFRLSKDDQWWVGFSLFEGMKDWHRNEYIEIINGEMKEKIKEKVIQFLEAFKGMAPNKYHFKPVDTAHLENKN